MKSFQSSKRNVLLACLIIAPLFHLIGDSLWLTKNFTYSWNIWREASYVFFIPAGFLLAKQLEQKNWNWAVAACALYIIGCFGSATMMPLFRLGAFYPTNGHYEFPAIVQSVLDKKTFAVTLFIPGLCLPVSLIVFGIGFLKHQLLNRFLGIAFIIAGILFWFGNAGELEFVLIVGDAWLLFLFVYFGYFYFRDKNAYKERSSFQPAFNN
jgi:hypothetical protein